MPERRPRAALRALICGVWTLLSPPAFAQSQAAGPEELIRSLYQDHVPGTERLISFDDGDQLARYFDPELTALFLKDRDCRRHRLEHCGLTIDPVYGVENLVDAAPEFDLRQLSGEPEVSFELTFADSSRRRLVYFMTRTEAGWRVSDIQYSDGPSLKALLERIPQEKSRQRQRRN